MTNLNTATITIDDIKKAETSDLLELYNEISGKSVKKFSSRAAGESQTWKLVQRLAPGEDIRKPVRPLEERSTIVKEKSPKKRETYENKIIQLLVEENNKRPGSRAHKKFDILMKLNGKTIKDLKKEEGRFPTLDMEKGWPATELRWALKLGLVKLVNG